MELYKRRPKGALHIAFLDHQCRIAARECN